MAKETEVFRAELDLTDVEKKAARAEQLMSDIKAKRGRGEDVSDLERSLHKELDGLTQVSKKEEQAADSTADLLKQKEKLGAVVRSLGGSFSGMVGDLGGVIELLMTGNAASLGLATALAGLAAGTAIFRSLKESAREYTEELDRLAEQHRTLSEEFLTTQERIAQVLESAGQAGRSEAVTRRAQKMSAEQGIDEDLAMFGAVAAELGGLSELETWNAMAGFLKTGRSAKFTGERAKDEAMLRQVGTLGAEPEAQAFLEARIEDTRKLVMARTAVPDQPVDAERRKRAWTNAIKEATRVEGLTPADVKALNRMKDWNLDPEALAQPHYMRALFPENFGKVDWMQWAWQPGKDAYETVAGERLEGGSRTIEELRSMAQQFQQVAGREAAEQRRTEPPVVLTILNIGSQYNAPDTRSRPLVGSVGVSAAAAGQHKVPLGG